MGSIKDRNGMDLTEAEDIKKRWQEYTELYKKELHDPDNHDGVITHLEPDILECEVKWALGSITKNKASGGDGIQVELFQIQKKILLKCCTQYASKFGKPSSSHRTGKGQFSFQSQRRAVPKNVPKHFTIALISYTSKVMLKILQARLQQYVNHELPDVQARFRKEIKLPTSIRSSKKQESSRKTTTSASLATPTLLTV